MGPASPCYGARGVGALSWNDCGERRRAFPGFRGEVVDAGGGRVGSLVADRPVRGGAPPGARQAPSWFDGQWADVIPGDPPGRPPPAPEVPALPVRVVRAGAAVAGHATGRGRAAAVVLVIVATLLGMSSMVRPSPPAPRIHRVATKAAVAPPVSALPFAPVPVSVPPVSAPPVTAPPLTRVPGTVPPVSAPPLTAAPVSVPAVSAPSTTAGPAGGAGPAVSTDVASVAQGIIAAVDQLEPADRQIPVTADNILLLGRWMAMEGGLWADNPLNTDLHAGQYPHQGRTGTPIYPSMEVGIQAAAATLTGSRAYASILSQLQSGTASCSAFATAVIRSPWAASHYRHDPAAFCGAAPGAALGGRGSRAGAGHRAPKIGRHTPQRPHRTSQP